MIKYTSAGIELHGQTELYGNLYVSYCGDLPLAGTGSTPEESIGSFMTCLMKYFELSREWGLAEAIAPRSPATMSPGEFAINLPRIMERQGAMA